MSKAWHHFWTVNRHRWLVCQGCFKVGLYWQGLTHDLSKYSPTEFRIGAKYYQGTRSPNAAERDLFGYSTAWMHHKGRNRHHYEYWTDMNPVTKQYESVPMPRKYLVEMVMDRRAACMTYQGKAYTDAAKLNVTPTPDSVLRVYMVAQPLSEPVEVEPQTFVPFVREGFTVVEWGGSILK